jgi:uncharacterized protein
MPESERVLHLKRFFEEARAGRLTGIRCDQCGELAIPPKELCPACGARAWRAVPLRGEGTITSFAVVQLAEGPQLLGRMVDVPLESLKMGLGVRFRPIVEGDQTLVGFGAA